MSKIHYFQRYSSLENTVTNNTLLLFGRIYDYSPVQLSKLLEEITGEQFEIGVEIHQQRPGNSSIPDGEIIQRSFRIVIEAKVDSGVDFNQLLRHAQNFGAESQKLLLLITKQPISNNEEKAITSKIASSHPDVSFKNTTHEKICKTIEGMFKEYEYEMKNLVTDYIEYCNDTGLYDQSRFLLRIVPCSESFDINKKYGIYFYPSDRNFTKHSFIGIYANKSVQSIWSVDSVFDVEFDGSKLTKKDLIDGRHTDDYDAKIINVIQDAKTIHGWNIEKGHRFYCGVPVDADYKKSSPYGIMGARLINLKDKIGEFTDANDVAQKLRHVTW